VINFRVISLVHECASIRLLASPLVGAVGVFEVQLELNSGLTTDPQTQLTIAQNIFVSNIVTFPVKAPK
jgi:hypothetical protein